MKNTKSWLSRLGALLILLLLIKGFDAIENLLSAILSAMGVRAPYDYYAAIALLPVVILGMIVLWSKIGKDRIKQYYRDAEMNRNNPPRSN